MQHHAMQYTDYAKETLPVFEAATVLDRHHVLAMILAGGRGERLYPLTGHRAKPAVPFGGSYRLIDFVLSNMVNSGIPEIHVLTQYHDHSLLRHLTRGWVRPYFSDGPLIMPTPAQLFNKDTRYLGTADAVYKNRVLIESAKTDLVLVFGADHVYRMDVRQMIRYHIEQGAEVTVATIPMPVKNCAQFGTVMIDHEWRIRRFKEKTPFPTPIPDRSDHALVSMGNYLFNADVLLEELAQDARDGGSSHDFGRDILPKLCARRRMCAYDFQTNQILDTEGSNRYWRDVGTIESYYLANMDLNNPYNQLNLDNPTWPVRSLNHHDLSAKVREDLNGNAGCVVNSILGNASVVAGGYVKDSVIGQNVHISGGAVVEESVILGDVIVEENAKIYRAIIDHGNVIGRGEKIGYDPDYDAARYYVDRCGVVVVPHHSYATAAPHVEAPEAKHGVPIRTSFAFEESRDHAIPSHAGANGAGIAR
jgi:glucose-1-phosphate adenylyltransferase